MGAIIANKKVCRYLRIILIALKMNLWLIFFDQYKCGLILMDNFPPVCDQFPGEGPCWRNNSPGYVVLIENILPSILKSNDRFIFPGRFTGYICVTFDKGFLFWP